MPQGLPRKIKLAFILQALIGSIAITLGILLAGLAVRHVVLEQRMQREADDYWDGRKRDPAYPLPRTSTTRGHFVPTGASDSVLPRLTASLTIFRWFKNANAWRSLPRSSRETIAPGEEHWR